MVTEGGGRLQHVVEDVAGEDQALLGLEPVGPGQGEGDGLGGSRLEGEDQTSGPAEPENIIQGGREGGRVAHLEGLQWHQTCRK